MSDLSEVVSGYLDGELVPAGAVLAALDTDEGRRALVDFVRLRLAMTNGIAPSPDFYARMRDVVPTRPAPQGRRRRNQLAWPVAAALAASLAIGFWTGAALTSRHAAAPSRVQSASPPRAARVIEFQRGVDWQQSPSEEVIR